METFITQYLNDRFFPPSSYSLLRDPAMKFKTYEKRFYHTDEVPNDHFSSWIVDTA